MRLLTNSVLAVLVAGGDRIGDAQAPTDSSRPYAVLYPLFVTDRDGPQSDDTADGWYEFQVTSVGDTRMQAEWMRDRTTAAMKAGSFPVTGFATGPVKPTNDVGVERDDDVQPPIYYSHQLLQIFVTPSP